MGNVLNIDSMVFPKPKTPHYSKNTINLIWVPKVREEIEKTGVFSFSSVEKRIPVNERIPCMFLPYHNYTDKIIIYFHGNAEDIGHAERFYNSVKDEWKVLLQ